VSILSVWGSDICRDSSIDIRRTGAAITHLKSMAFLAIEPFRDWLELKLGYFSIVHEYSLFVFLFSCSYWREIIMWLQAALSFTSESNSKPIELPRRALANCFSLQSISLPRSLGIIASDISLAVNLLSH
jgi:hypothetical protein